MTNLCAVKYLPRCKAAVLPMEAEESPTQPEIPASMEETFLPIQEEAPATEAPVLEETAPEVDVDEIIADILRQIDSNVE